MPKPTQSAVVSFDLRGPSSTVPLFFSVRANNSPHQRDQRIAALKKMKGTDFAMAVASDFIVLPKEERGRAVRVLSALSETIEREVAAAQ